MQLEFCQREGKIRKEPFKESRNKSSPPIRGLLIEVNATLPHVSLINKHPISYVLIHSV